MRILYARIVLVGLVAMVASCGGAGTPPTPSIANAAISWSPECAAALDASVTVGRDGIDVLGPVDDRLRGCWRAAVVVVDRARRGKRAVEFPSCRALRAGYGASGFPALAEPRDPWFAACRRVEASTPDVVELVGRPAVEKPEPALPPNPFAGLQRSRVIVMLEPPDRPGPPPGPPLRWNGLDRGPNAPAPEPPRTPWDLSPAARVLCATLHDVIDRFGTRVEIPLATVVATDRTWTASWPDGSNTEIVEHALTTCLAGWAPRGFALELVPRPPRLIVRKTP